MASNISICGICDLRHLSSPSTHWCQDCDEALCSECKEHHTLLKATRGHTTIPIDDYKQLPTFITNIKQYCDIHNEKYQNYCQKHECPICYKCIQDHVKCAETILPLETVIEHSKTSQIFQDLNQCVSDLQSNITQMRTAREDNLVKVADQCKSAVKEIREFRIKLNRHLDAVEKGLIIKLQDAVNKCCLQIKEVIKSLNEVESEISKFENLIQSIKQHASELQVYLATREIEKQLSDKETRLTSMMENKHFDDLYVCLDLDTKIRNILSDVKVFGTVTMETVPTNYKLTNTKSRQAQIITAAVKSFDDITLNQVHKFDSGSINVTGCIILPDGRMAFTGYGQKQLSIRNADGSPDFQIPLKESTAFDLTLVKDAIVAVSCGFYYDFYKKCIQIIDLNSREITKIIDTTNRAYGIVCVDELLVFIGCTPNGIYDIDMKTKKQSQISSTIDSGQWSYITYFKNKFYVTNGTNHTVTSFDNKGNIMWAYKDDVNMKEPRGISVDNSGNVFIASAGSNNVTIISPDGSCAKQILGKKNGLNEPCTLHYDRSTNQLLVANVKGTVYLFNV
ncbi:tripartite motif-containing protein 2-like [Mytilus edulis]|uniref:tripartite motif-containing protein 2-like n=1 Tax=Mytilus edulis TaxID=6550 RepID=UPI0039EEDAC9